MEMVGKNGVITVEEAQTTGLSKEVVEGMQFDEGYISPYMMTDTKSMEANFENPYILITDKKISAVNEIVPLLEKLAQAGKKELVIIAEEVEGEALTTLVLNKLRGVFNTLAVKAPGFGDRRKEMLGDIAVLTGAQVISDDLGLKLEDATIEQLGSARRIIADKEKTTLVEGKPVSKREVEARIAQIEEQIKNTKSEFDREKLEERLGKLSNGVGVLKVGAATESELTYLKHKIEDAVAATKAAVAEGIVSGGGVALLEASKSLENYKLSGEESIGVEILKKALIQPLKLIAENAGKDGSVIVDAVRRKSKGIGYDAKNDKYVDMISSGIIDPLKVTRSALQNSASAAGMILTTEAAVSDAPEKCTTCDSGANAGAGMGGGMPGGMPMM